VHNNALLSLCALLVGKLTSLVSASGAHPCVTQHEKRILFPITIPEKCLSLSAVTEFDTAVKRHEQVRKWRLSFFITTHVEKKWTSCHDFIHQCRKMFSFKITLVCENIKLRPLLDILHEEKTHKGIELMWLYLPSWYYFCSTLLSRVNNFGMLNVK
jgi:hypothetical protein